MYKTPNDRELAIGNAKQFVSELPPHYATYLDTLIQQESNWNPDLESGTGARGIGQFIRGTWKETYEYLKKNPGRFQMPAGMSLESIKDYDKAWKSPLASTVMTLGNALRLEDVALKEINKGRARGGLPDATSVIEAFNNDPRQWASVISVGHKDGAGRIKLFVDDTGAFNPDEALDFYGPRHQKAQQEAANLRAQAKALEASGATGPSVQRLYEQARKLSNSDANGHVFGYADHMGSTVGEAFGMGPTPFTAEQTQKMYDLRIPTHTDGNQTVKRLRERMNTGVGVVDRVGDVPLAQIQQQRRLSQAGRDFAVPDYVNIYGQERTEQPIDDTTTQATIPTALEDTSDSGVAIQLPNRNTSISEDGSVGDAAQFDRDASLPPVRPETLEGIPGFSDAPQAVQNDPNFQFDAVTALPLRESEIAESDQLEFYNSDGLDPLEISRRSRILREKHGFDPLDGNGSGNLFGETDEQARIREQAEYNRVVTGQYRPQFAELAEQDRIANAQRANEWGARIENGRATTSAEIAVQRELEASTINAERLTQAPTTSAFDQGQAIRQGTGELVDSAQQGVANAGSAAYDAGGRAVDAAGNFIGNIADGVSNFFDLGQEQAEFGGSKILRNILDDESIIPGLVPTRDFLLGAFGGPTPDELNATGDRIVQEQAQDVVDILNAREPEVLPPITSGPPSRGQLGAESRALADLQSQQEAERNASPNQLNSDLGAFADLGDPFNESRRNTFGFAPGDPGYEFNKTRQLLLDDAAEREALTALNDSAAIRRALIPELNIGADRESINAIFPEADAPADFGLDRPARENFAPFANDSVNVDTPSNKALAAMQGFLSETQDGTRNARARTETLEALQNIDPVAARQIAVNAATLGADPFLSLDDNADLYREFQVAKLRPESIQIQDKNLASLRDAESRSFLRKDPKSLRNILEAIANERRDLLSDQFLTGFGSDQYL